jgi:hypothetical protein
VQSLAILVLASVGIPKALAQSEVNAGPNTQCVERLQTPVYPKLADQARVSGSFTVIISLASDGTVKGTTLEMPEASPVAKRLFPPAIDRALQASVFQKHCESKPVRLVFTFGIGEESETNNVPQTVAFGYPNRSGFLYRRDISNHKRVVLPVRSWRWCIGDFRSGHM